MRISLVVAMDENRLIGADNGLPWRLPADLQHFKQVTMGKPIVMGRKTHESIGRSLPGRTNIVVSRDTNYVAEGCTVVHSVKDALAAADDVPEVMIVGGAEFYAQALPNADRIYLTEVHHSFDGDAWFPLLDRVQWREVAREDHPTDEKNAYAYSFLTLERTWKAPV